MSEIAARLENIYVCGCFPLQFFVRSKHPFCRLLNKKVACFLRKNVTGNDRNTSYFLSLYPSPTCRVTYIFPWLFLIRSLPCLARSFTSSGMLSISICTADTAVQRKPTILRPILIF